MYRDLTITEYAPDFVEVHERILRLDFTVYVGGHLTRLGNRQDVEIQRDYVNDVLTHARFAFATVDFAAVIASLEIFNPTSPNFLNYWVLLQTWRDQQIAICTERVLSTWAGRLGAVDVWTHTHCHRMLESINID